MTTVSRAALTDAARDIAALVAEHDDLGPAAARVGVDVDELRSGAATACELLLPFVTSSAFREESERLWATGYLAACSCRRESAPLDPLGLAVVVFALADEREPAAPELELPEWPLLEGLLGPATRMTKDLGGLRQPLVRATLLRLLGHAGDCGLR